MWTHRDLRTRTPAGHGVGPCDCDGIIAPFDCANLHELFTADGRYHLICLRYCLACGNTIVEATEGDNGSNPLRLIVRDHRTPAPFASADAWPIVSEQALEIRWLQDELQRSEAGVVGPTQDMQTRWLKARLRLSKAGMAVPP